MLDEFHFLGEERHMKSSLKIQNALADRIERVVPIKDQLFTQEWRVQMKKYVN